MQGTQKILKMKMVLIMVIGHLMVEEEADNDEEEKES